MTTRINRRTFRFIHQYGLIGLDIEFRHFWGLGFGATTFEGIYRRNLSLSVHLICITFTLRLPIGKLAARHS